MQGPVDARCAQIRGSPGSQRLGRIPNQSQPGTDRFSLEKDLRSHVQRGADHQLVPAALGRPTDLVQETEPGWAALWLRLPTRLRTARHRRQTRVPRPTSYTVHHPTRSEAIRLYCLLE